VGEDVGVGEGNGCVCVGRDLRGNRLRVGWINPRSLGGISPLRDE